MEFYEISGFPTSVSLFVFEACLYVGTELTVIMDHSAIFTGPRDLTLCFQSAMKAKGICGFWNHRSV